MADLPSSPLRPDRCSSRQLKQKLSGSPDGWGRPTRHPNGPLAPRCSLFIDLFSFVRLLLGCLEEWAAVAGLSPLV